MRVLALTLLVVLSGAARAEEPKFTAEQVAFYEKEVAPVLKANCLKCHGNDEKKIRGGLRMTNRAAILKGGDNGPVVDFAKPDRSVLLLAIRNKRPNAGEVMPPTGAMPEKDVATLVRWVHEKLPVPAKLLADGEQHAEEKGGVVTPESRNYWAYRPIAVPTVPAVKAATPIDAFLVAKLQAQGLTQNGPAEKVALLRRAYYDLTGLPPTPEQVDAFANDRSPDAFAKVVDQLLASPRYGEKWGRHWLDIVRYAETNGYERDGPKPFAWKYRDYVIRSFNADKPYDVFLKEQIAGDELPGDNPDAIIATGFYRLGTWDDEPADPQQALFDGYDDLVTVVGQGILGMTVNCARCHDHKKDPIPQADYYRLLAFFRDIRPFSNNRDVRSRTNLSDVTPPERRKVYEAALKERQGRIDDLAKAMVGLEDAAIKTMPAEDQRASEGLDRPRVVAKVPQFLDADGKAKYQTLKRERTELEKKPMPSQELALSVNNCEVRPPQTHILARGNPHAMKNDKTQVSPGFPQVLGDAEAVIPALPANAKTSGRRTVLANWLTSKPNQLTPRVIVNRLWQHHFGRGIVPTPSDFGKLGEAPTHPELLDWLAADFTAHGWTLKRMHKQMMLTSAYQMASTANPAALKADPANNLLWRFNMRRLAAEEVRDTMLNASGKLNLAAFGPSVFPKIPQAVLAGQSVPGDGWLASKGGGYDPAKPDAGNRRSVYTFVKRSLQVPILIVHDQADTDSSCPVRYTTTVPTQALGMINGEFANEQAAAFAARLAKDAPNDLPAQVRRAIRLTTGRPATDAEVAKDVAFVQELRAKFQLDAATSLGRYALLALNANEFIYLD